MREGILNERGNGPRMDTIVDDAYKKTKRFRRTETKKKIIISINPESAEKILSGEKKFEYRTRVAKQQADTLIIYATKPVMKVVAEVEILDIIATSPEELWNKTKNHPGLPKHSLTNTSKKNKWPLPIGLGR